ncbi:hypothetical protein LINPERHAP1_LOCUS21327 [Linum perenne]
MHIAYRVEVKLMEMNAKLEEHFNVEQQFKHISDMVEAKLMEINAKLEEYLNIEQ